MRLKQLFLILIVSITLFFLDYKVAIAQSDPILPSTQIATTTPFVVPKTDPIFEKIAWCESRNNPRAKSPTSSASGRFQFINQTWYDYGREYWGKEFYNKNIWSYEDNTALALYVYKKYGTKDWNASKHCWGTV